MSKIKLSAVAATTIILGVALAITTSHSFKSQRAGSFGKSTKLASVGGKTYPKSFGLLIESDSPQPIEPKKSFMLTLSVSSREELRDLELNWILPQGVMILKGSTEQVVAIKPGEIKKIEILLQVDDDQNYLIMASASHSHEGIGTEGSGRHGFTAQFLTNPAKLDSKHTNIIFPQKVDYGDSSGELIKAPHLAQ